MKDDEDLTDRLNRAHDQAREALKRFMARALMVVVVCGGIYYLAGGCDPSSDFKDDDSYYQVRW